MICEALLGPLAAIIRGIYQFTGLITNVTCTAVEAVLVAVEVILEEVCGFVTTLIERVRTVVEEVCRRLPWPLNWLCDQVVRVIRWTEAITEWTCRNVIASVQITRRVVTRVVCERVLRFLHWLVGYAIEVIFMVLKWGCFPADWTILRGFWFWRCRRGDRHPRGIPICIRVIADIDGNRTPPATVDQMIQDANAILSQCNISLIVEENVTVVSDDFHTLNVRGVNAQRLRFLVWAPNNSCGCCTRLTVFVAGQITGASGFHPSGARADYVVVDGSATNIAGTLVQEIAHAADLLRHSDDPNSVMAPGDGTNIADGHCCWIRTARFTRRLGIIGAAAARN